MNDQRNEFEDRAEKNSLCDLFHLSKPFFRSVYRQLDVHLTRLGVLLCDREDLIHEALLKAVVHRHQFAGGDPERRIRCWLIKTVHRLVLDWKRRLARRSCEALEAVTEEPTDEREAKRAATGELIELANVMLEKAGADNETSVRLLLGHFLQGYSISELAQQFGISENAVDSRIRRLLSKLRELAEEFSRN